MPQDAFTIRHVVNGLKKTVAGGKISRIIQYDRDSLTFIIYTEKGNVKLDLCLSAKWHRISLTNCDKPVPQTAPAFCMLLRKHLQNAQITGVEQIPDERVVKISFDCTSEFEREKLDLYAELMGKYSNAVLCRGGVILGALKQTSLGESTKRALFPGLKYILPEAQDKTSPHDTEGIKKLFEGAAGDMAKFISQWIKGVAYSTACDIVLQYGEKPTAEQVTEYLCSDEISPCVTYSDGRPDDFKAKSCLPDKKPYDDILGAQTAYYDYVYAEQTFENAKKRLAAAPAGALKKLGKRLQVIREKLLECKDAEELRLKGELLTANIYAVRRGDSSFEAVNYYDESLPKVKIALDKTLTPAQNAQKYFKRYAKLKRTKETVSGQLAETEQKISYLKSIEAHISLAECLADLAETEEELKATHLMAEETKGKKKKPVQTPFRSYTIGGYKVLAGRNNLQNDRLLKSVSGGDIWLHTKNYHSSHVVIVCGGKPVPGEVLVAAAEICAYYSDGRGGTKIPVDYTLKKYVKKPPAAAAGFVIYSEYKTILAEPDKHQKECDDEAK